MAPLLWCMVMDGHDCPVQNGSLISLHTLSDVEKGVYKIQPTTATYRTACAL